jgi:hypothetical protein
MMMSARLLSHPYIIMGEIDKQGYICEIDQDKLLPPAGKYEATLQPTSNANNHNISNIDNLPIVLLEVKDNRTIKINATEEYCQLKVLLEINSDKLL